MSSTGSYNWRHLNLQPGDVVKFWYNGGSGSGYRTLTVAQVNSDHLAGECAERKGEYRQFLGSKMGLVNVLSRAGSPTVTTLRFDKVKELLERGGVVKAALDLMTGEQLAKLVKAREYTNDRVDFDPISGNFRVTAKSWQKTLDERLVFEGTPENPIVKWDGKNLTSVAELVDKLNTL